jgi:hypothetical protein
MNLLEKYKKKYCKSRPIFPQKSFSMCWNHIYGSKMQNKLRGLPKKNKISKVSLKLKLIFEPQKRGDLKKFNLFFASILWCN